MSDSPDAPKALPAVTAVWAEHELAMFEVVALDGDRLVVWTPFALATGEELPLQIERIGRTTGRVVGHSADGTRTLTELRIELVGGSAA